VGQGTGAARGRPPDGDLLTDAEATDQVGVPLGVLRLDVVEQPATLTDQLEQAAARMVILGVDLEMLGEIADALTSSATSGDPVSVWVRPIAVDDWGRCV
jgi:hypothetical protein